MRLADRLLDLLCLPAKWVSWLTLPLIASILAAVVLAKMGQNTLVSWSQPLPVLGRAITVNSLLDIQWYVFALLVLFGGIMAYRNDRHVAVETIALNLPPRGRLLIRVLGDLLFLAPFCAIIAWYGYAYAMTAYTTGEGSTQGGLMDRWLIKAMLPLAFAMLTAAGVVRGISGIVTLVRGR